MAWAPDYVTAVLLKPYININHGDSGAEDLWLANWATAVSRNVDDFCGRQFGKVDLAETRSYYGVWDRNKRKTYVEIDDIQDLTGLAVEDADGNVITDYTLEPLNAISKGSVHTRLILDNYYCNNLTLTGIWGWNSVPPSIPTAAYIQASRLNARRSSPFGIAGSPSDGAEIRLLAQLDPDFKTSLKPYVRKWYAA